MFDWSPGQGSPQVNGHFLRVDLGYGDHHDPRVLLVAGVVHEEVLPELHHLLERVPARRHGHQVVEELRGRGEVLQHELLVAKGVEDMLRGEQPTLPVVHLQHTKLEQLQSKDGAESKPNPCNNFLPVLLVCKGGQHASYSFPSL